MKEDVVSPRDRVCAHPVVSSIETVSTQSKVSLRGSPSSTSSVRSRIVVSMFLRLLGAT